MQKLNNKFILNMGKELKIGKMALNTKAIGETAWPTAKAYSIMPMVMYIPVNFNRIKPMDSGSTSIKMVKHTKDTGRITSKKA